MIRATLTSRRNWCMSFRLQLATASLLSSDVNRKNFGFSFFDSSTTYWQVELERAFGALTAHKAKADALQQSKDPLHSIAPATICIHSLC